MRCCSLLFTALVWTFTLFRFVYRCVPFPHVVYTRLLPLICGLFYLWLRLRYPFALRTFVVVTFPFTDYDLLPHVPFGFTVCLYAGLFGYVVRYGLRLRCLFVWFGYLLIIPDCCCRYGLRFWLRWFAVTFRFALLRFYALRVTAVTGYASLRALHTVYTDGCIGPRSPAHVYTVLHLGYHGYVYRFGYGSGYLISFLVAFTLLRWVLFRLRLRSFRLRLIVRSRWLAVIYFTGCTVTHVCSPTVYGCCNLPVAVVRLPPFY